MQGDDLRCEGGPRRTCRKPWCWSRRQGQVGGHGDFYHDDVKTMKTSRRKGLYHITYFYEVLVMFIPLVHPCLMRGSHVLLGWSLPKQCQVDSVLPTVAP